MIINIALREFPFRTLTLNQPPSSSKASLPRLPKNSVCASLGLRSPLAPIKPQSPQQVAASTLWFWGSKFRLRDPLKGTVGIYARVPFKGSMILGSITETPLRGSFLTLLLALLKGYIPKGHPNPNS